MLAIRWPDLPPTLRARGGPLNFRLVPGPVLSAPLETVWKLVDGALILERLPGLLAVDFIVISFGISFEQLFLLGKLSTNY